MNRQRPGQSPLRCIWRSGLVCVAVLLAVWWASAAFAGDGDWNVDASGNWGTDTNWSPVAVPGGGGSTINLTLNIGTATRVVTIDSTSRTIGILNIGDTNNSHAYTLQGDGATNLTFDNTINTADAQINQVSTSKGDTISVPILLASSLDITNSSANALTISGGITAVSGTKTITVNGRVTFSGAVGNGGGTVSLVKDGSDTLALSANNSFSGGMQIKSGTISASGDATITGALGAGAITIGETANANSATLALTSSGTFTSSNTSGFTITSGGTRRITYAGSGTLTKSGNFTLANDLNITTGVTAGSGSLTLSGGISGTGNLTLDGTNGNTLTLSGVLSFTGGVTSSYKNVVLKNAGSTYSGATSIIGGVVSVLKLANGGSSSSIGNASVTSTNLLINGGTLKLDGAQSGSVDSSTNRLFDIGLNGATLDSTGNTTANEKTLSFTGTGALGFNGQTGARLLTLTGNSHDNNNLTPVVGDGGGATSVTKSGVGTWVLSGANTYSGTTTISNGTLKVGAAGAIPNGGGKGDVIIDGGAVAGILDLNGNDTTINGLSGTNGAVLGQVLNDATATNKTLTLGAGNATASFAGVIADHSAGTGTVAVTKTGSGTQTLGGDSSYSGATTVGAGTLLVNGTTSGQGDYVVAATLGGSGTIGLASTRKLSLSTGGHLAPGGVFTVTGNQSGTPTTGAATVNLVSGSSFDVDLAGTIVGSGYDQLSVTGNVDLGGATLNVNRTLTLNANQFFTIILNDGVAADDAVLGTFNGLAEGATVLTNNAYDLKITYAGESGALSGSGNDVVLYTTPAPEPSAAALAAVAAAGLLRRRRRTV